jgi:hypothetical protein
VKPQHRCLDHVILFAEPFHSPAARRNVGRTELLNDSVETFGSARRNVNPQDDPLLL